jgi:hypothetical protein
VMPTMATIFVRELTAEGDAGIAAISSCALCMLAVAAWLTCRWTVGRVSTRMAPMFSPWSPQSAGDRIAVRSSLRLPAAA